MRISLAVLGCKISQYDAARLEERLRQAGAEIIPPSSASQAFLLCGCAVTERAAREAGQVARRLQRLNSVAPLYYYGCIGAYFANQPKHAAAGYQAATGYQARQAPGRVSYQACCFPPGRETALLEALGLSSPTPVSSGRSWRRTRGLVKVQDGCSHFCTYCIVPHLRGPAKSRPIREIEGEVADLLYRGFREVVLSGVHLSSWGHDLGGYTLIDLLHCLDRLPGLDRLRLSSLEPMDLSPQTMASFRTIEHLCPHFHLPLQSGSDSILQRMGRGYDRAQFLRLVEATRAAWPDVALTTDIMIGFPGESEQDFQATLATIEAVSFTRLHLFRYSPRPGTPAASMTGPLDEKEKRRRLERLRTLAETLPTRFRRRFLGRSFPVLVERIRESQASGFTPNYIHLTFPAYPGLLVGQLVEVKVSEEEPDA
ncbi:MAG: MiaB/RimO family radical SAM methylthiotransferase [Coprothermobacterota bacterium]|nr:MiaB/RimO family radical SAM methylthiotransferase [Coprothermobacterota bacterium]